MNVKNLLLYACLAGAAFFGWKHFNKDIQKTRDSLGIKPHAVVMLWVPECGEVCLDQARQIARRGIEVVNLDVNDGGSGTKLWEAIGGGNGPFPTFLIDKEVFRTGQDGDLRSKLLSVYGSTALKSVEKQYFKKHFNADASSRAVLYTAEWCGYCKQIRSDLESTNTPFTEIDVEKHYNPQELAEVMNIPGFPTVYFGYQKIEGDVSDMASQLRANLKK
jgi:glutaredoxin